MTAAPQSTLLAAVEALQGAWCRDAPTMSRIDAALSLLRAALEAREPISDERILEIAHRTATRYTHRSDPNDHSYGFVKHTLLNFARKVLAASPVAAPVEAREGPQPVAVRYRSGKQWRYLNFPFTKGWTFPPNLGTPEPLYASPVAADTQGDAQDAAAAFDGSPYLGHYATAEDDVTVTEGPADEPHCRVQRVELTDAQRAMLTSTATEIPGAAMKEQPSDGADRRCLLPAEKTTGTGVSACDGWRTSADGLTRTKIAPDAAAPTVPSECVTLRMGADGKLTTDGAEVPRG